MREPPWQVSWGKEGRRSLGEVDVRLALSVVRSLVRRRVLRLSEIASVPIVITL